MAGCILICLFVQEEFHYADFHSKGHRLFRVLRQSMMAGSGEQMETSTSAAITPSMLRDFPEVEAAARLLDDWGIWVKRGDAMHYADVALGDASLLEMFDMDLVAGDRATALDQPNTVLISETAAERIFADQDPLGEVVTVEDDRLGGDFVIAGVVRISPYSHVYFDFLTTHPRESLKGPFNGWNTTTSWRPFKNYIMLREGITAAQMEAKLPEFEVRYLGEDVAASLQYHLQPVDRIRLYSEVDYGMKTGSSIRSIYRLALIGLLILLIACLNFMNLATAQSTRRAREVGVRKVVGAGRTQLAVQFLGEAALLAFAALPLACWAARSALPYFNEFMRANLKFALSPSLLAALFGLALLVGAVSGSYPAFFLSRFRPVETLKGKLSAHSSARTLRQSLVVFQFCVSCVLIIASTVVYQQMEYANQKDLGYDKRLLINIPLWDHEVAASPEVVKRAFLDHPTVLSGTISHPAPGFWNVVEYHAVRPEGEAAGEWEMQAMSIDGDFLETFGIELVAGRNLDSSREADKDAFLLNETAVRQLGWDDPIGKRFDWLGRKSGHVVGVVRDFHTQSLHSPIEPLVMHHWTHRTVTIRISGEDIPGTLAHLEKSWKHFLPDIPVNHWFLEGNLARYYRSEKRLNEICSLFSLLAVFIACLGLFGLASYTAEQRTKEIGIRKAVGASASSIVSLLSRDFIRLIVIANMVAGPIAYYLMSSWLGNFPYRIDLSSAPFLLCGGATLLVAVLTVTYQSVKAASASPVESLRYE